MNEGPEATDIENNRYHSQEYEWEQMNESEEHNSLLEKFRKTIDDEQVQVKVKSKVN